MTRNKEAAYRSAIEHAFRGKQADIDKHQAVSYVPTDPEFQRSSAIVMDALEQLPDSEEVDLETFAFMLGIGPSALNKREDRPDPYKRLESEVPSMGGKTRPSSKPVWTIQQVKTYRDDKAEHGEERKDEQSSAAVSRRSKRKELKDKLTALLELLHEHHQQAQKSDAPPDVMRVVSTAVEAIVTMNGLLLGFVGLHNLSRDELRDAFRAGARIERVTLRQAMIERTWASPAALQPWAYEYQRLIEDYVVRERDLVAAAVARSENNDLGELPKAKSTPPRKGLRM